MTDFLDHTGDSPGVESRHPTRAPVDISESEAAGSASFFTEWQLDPGDDDAATVTD